MKARPEFLAALVVALILLFVRYAVPEMAKNVSEMLAVVVAQDSLAPIGAENWVVMSADEDRKEALEKEAAWQNAWHFILLAFGAFAGLLLAGIAIWCRLTPIQAPSKRPVP